MTCNFCLIEKKSGYIQSDIAEVCICINCIKAIDDGMYVPPLPIEETSA